MATFHPPEPARRVRIIAAGGTIAMAGDRGRAGARRRRAGRERPGAAGMPGLEAQTLNMPSAHLTPDDQLRICRAARDAARRGIGVVVTHGTDTLEETAMLCDVMHDAEAPIVFTGAIRPASAPGADGPANLIDAVSVAPSQEAAGLGVLVVFGGEIHHARCARKTDTTSLVAFSSPQTGPLGRVTEGHPTFWSRLPRNPPLDPPSSTSACSSCPRPPATTARSPAPRCHRPRRLVIGTLGAGHLAPEVLELWAEAAKRIPVVAYCRPERGVVLTRPTATRAPRTTCAEPNHPGRLPVTPGVADEAAGLPCLRLSIDETRWAFRQDDG